MYAIAKLKIIINQIGKNIYILNFFLKIKNGLYYNMAIKFNYTVSH